MERSRKADFMGEPPAALLRRRLGSPPIVCPPLCADDLESGPLDPSSIRKKEEKESRSAAETILRPSAFGTGPKNDAELRNAGERILPPSLALINEQEEPS